MSRTPTTTRCGQHDVPAPFSVETVADPRYEDSPAILRRITAQPKMHRPVDWASRQILHGSPFYRESLSSPAGRSEDSQRDTFSLQGSSVQASAAKPQPDTLIIPLDQRKLYFFTPSPVMPASCSRHEKARCQDNLSYAMV